MARASADASSALPSQAELEQVLGIRTACTAEIQALSSKTDDVVGDLRVCRFLRACHGDVQQATNWFRGFLRWRVERGIDVARQEVVGRSPQGILQWYDARRNPYLGMCPYGGRNQDGQVLWFMHPGFGDPVKFVQHRQISQDEDLKTILLLLEWTMWHLDNLSREESRMVYCIKVADLRHLGEDGRRLAIFVPSFMAFFHGTIKAMQQNYCDHDSMFVLLNTPWIFRTAWGVIKKLLTKRQVSKFRILGDTRTKEGRAALLDIVPENLLHTEYGGPVRRLPGFLPLDTKEEVEHWYQSRHLVPVEIFNASPPPATTRPVVEVVASGRVMEIDV